MFAVYKSSAGSGKTFTLVKEYLKICLAEPARFSSILAITFTNKAAAEMKTRIIDSLHRFLSTGSDEIIKCAIEETKLDSGLAAQNARTLLDRILHSYSDFSVMTIDSFIVRIVHAFSYDLGLPVKYDVELNVPGITAEIVERLLDSAGLDNFTGRVLTDFALAKIHSTGSWSIDRDLKTLGEITFNEKNAEPVGFLASGRYNEAFWEKLIQTLDDECTSFQDRVRSRSREGLDIIARHSLAIENFTYGKSGTAGTLARLAEAAGPKDFNIGQRFQDGMCAAKSAPQEIKNKIQSALADGLDRVRTDLIDTISTNLIRFISHYLVRKNIYSEALIGRFLMLTEAYKTEENVIPLFDFSKKVSEVVKSEPVPYLYYRMGEKYSHIMIDEFQDTSRLQWMNLKPLVEESVASGHFSMAVGDGKQSIYRWRAGDVKIMEEQLPEDLGVFIEEHQLSRNFRSRKEIVEFNNRFFTLLTEVSPGSADSLYSRLYSKSLVGQEKVSEETGYVQIRTMNTNEGRLKVDKQAVILEQMMEDILSIIHEKNGYTLKDIAVLVRWNHDAEAAARFLSEKGIGVISPETLLLARAPAVRFIISCLRLLSSGDPIALAHMWLFTGHDIREFEKKFPLKGGPSAMIRTLSEPFADRMLSLFQLPVYEAIEEIIRIFGLGQTNSGFIQGLLEETLKFSEKISSEIPRFLEWWDEEKARATLPSADKGEAVTLSTVHKAKGLEYPIVMIPFGWEITDRPRGDKPDFLWVTDSRFGRDLEDFPFIIDGRKDAEASWFQQALMDEQEMSRIDNLNLLYVAFTRAADRLYLYLEEDHQERQGTGNTHALIREVTARMNLCQKAGTLWVGARTARTASVPSPIETSVLDSLPSGGWRSKITMKRRAAELWKLDETGLKEKAEAGLVMHEILAGITTESDIDKAIEFQVQAGVIGSAEKEEYLGKIHSLMDISCSKGKVRDWFRPGLEVKNEKSIVSADRESRPDRVVTDTDRTLVIDFKTGQKSPEHASQIERYGRLLEEMGYRNVEKVLVYIETREAVEV